MACLVLKIGELVWIGLGAEVFTEIGLNLKRMSGSKYPIFSSMTNGSIGYLPTSEEHALGGYEVDISPFFYRFPGRLCSHSEKITYKKIQEILETM
jgi:hypothetical protein